MGYKTEIFNVGNYRRQHLGAMQPSDFFDPANSTGTVGRRQGAMFEISTEIFSRSSCCAAIVLFSTVVPSSTSQRKRPDGMWLAWRAKRCAQHYLRMFTTSQFLTVRAPTLLICLFISQAAIIPACSDEHDG
jgi:hypothetical protein